MAERRHTPAQRDSFWDLVDLMNQRKPYTPGLQVTSEPQFASPSSGMRSANRETVDGGSSSSWARPASGPASVADFLREEEEHDSIVRAARPAVFRERDMQRLDSLFKKLNTFGVDDDEASVFPETPSPRYREPLLIPELESPIRRGPTDLPTPVKSSHPTPVPFLTEPDTAVRLPKHVWDGMGKDLDRLETEKRDLQETISKLERHIASRSNEQRHDLPEKVSKIERHTESRGNENDDIASRLGLLKYQNEANRTQKADMGRALNEKEAKIKIQQLDIDELKAKLMRVETQLKQLSGMAGERDYLRNTLSTLHDENRRTLEKMAVSRDLEVKIARESCEELEAKLERVKSERDTALRACVNSGDHATQAKNLRDTIDMREKVITNLRQKHLEEKERVMHLETELECLKARVNPESVADLKDKLREKSSLCDRLRSQLKSSEQNFKISQERVMKVSNNGDSLRGGAHLVAPQANGKLPKNVVSCSECYANNITCDSSACCRSCSERNTQCARWRCSLKHKLGVCNLAPCKLPHDSQGWLILQDNRPQW